MSSKRAPAIGIDAVLDLARPEIRALRPYEHAQWHPGLERLHANESPWRILGDRSIAGLNRYPEPQPRALIERLAKLYEVDAGCVLAGRGSDEGIDLLTRAFCRSGRDAVLVCPPTFGMYAVAAKIQGADVVSVPLLPHSGFALDAAGVLAALSERVRIVYLCSPNNPTGNSFDRDAIACVVAAAAGRALVVIDEAYLEFSGEPSTAGLMASWPHVVVLRTMSKAQGLAGARLGVLIAHHAIVALLRKIIPPYAITQSTIEMALRALESPQQAVIAFRIKEIVRERERLSRALSLSPQVRRVWPSAANFVLAQCVDATTAFERGRAAGLLVRTYLGTPDLEQCLRITIGTAEQNDRLIRSLA